MAQASHTLHFSSQSEADKYVISQEIKALRTKRVTRSTAPILSQQITKLETRLDALASPIYKLSDDVLAEIFKVGMLLEADPAAFSEVSYHFVRTVSRVASRFRHVALTTPILWTRTRISLNDAFVDARKLDVMARRAAALPLHLEIIMDEQCSLQGPALHDTVADRLMTVSSAVERLYICNVRSFDDWPGTDKLLFLKLFKACPLKRFDLLGPFPSPGIGARAQTKLLKEKIHLNEFNMMYAGYPHSSIAQDRIRLPSLSSITCCYESLQGLLASANLSNVSHVTIERVQTSLIPHWGFPDERRFLSVPELRILTLERPNFIDWNRSFIISVVSVIPSLFELHIIDGHFCGKPPPLDDLLDNNGETYPKLNLLRLSKPNAPMLTVVLWVELLVSGHDPHGRGLHLDLQGGTLDLLDCPPIDVTTQTRLKKYVGTLKCHSNIDTSTVQTDGDTSAA